MSDTRYRSIVKAISYRFFGSILSLLIGWIITGSLVVGLGIGVSDLIIKTTFYYCHERIWNRLPHGRKNLEKNETGKDIKN